jgi:hypothetical protein
MPSVLVSSVLLLTWGMSFIMSPITKHRLLQDLTWADVIALR